MFEDIKAAIVKDRYAYIKDFVDNFYNVERSGCERISEQAWQAGFDIAAGASPYASYACVDTWLTDFRDDLPKLDVPTLVLHGTADRILPMTAAADRLPVDRRCPSREGRGRTAQHRLDSPEEVNKALLELVDQRDKRPAGS